MLSVASDILHMAVEANHAATELLWFPEVQPQKDTFSSAMGSVIRYHPVDSIPCHRSSKRDAPGMRRCTGFMSSGSRSCPFDAALSL